MNRAAKVIVLLFVLLIIALGGAGYFFWKYKNTTESAQTGDQAEVQEIIERVGRHVVLPEGETPTVANVANVEELQDQDFFKNAKNGYKVLVYQQARQAILYDPESDRVVNMATINPGDVGTDGTTPTEVQPASENTQESTVLGDETVVQ